MRSSFFLPIPSLLLLSLHLACSGGASSAPPSNQTVGTTGTDGGPSATGTPSWSGGSIPDYGTQVQDCINGCVAANCFELSCDLACYREACDRSCASHEEPTGCDGGLPHAPCNDLTPAAASEAGAPPSPPSPPATGGTIVDGTYVSTDSTPYQTASGSSSYLASYGTLVFEAGTFRRISIDYAKDSNGPRTTTTENGTYRTDGTTLTVTSTCLFGSNGEWVAAIEGQTHYTATPTSLTLFPDHRVAPLDPEITYIRQDP